VSSGDCCDAPFPQSIEPGTDAIFHTGDKGADEFPAMCPGRREVIGTAFVDSDFCYDAVANQVEQIGGNLSVR
jgi:hypothetical protein